MYANIRILHILFSLEHNLHNAGIFFGEFMAQLIYMEIYLGGVGEDDDAISHINQFCLPDKILSDK